MQNIALQPGEFDLQVERFSVSTVAKAEWPSKCLKEDIFAFDQDYW